MMSPAALLRAVLWEMEVWEGGWLGDDKKEALGRTTFLEHGTGVERNEVAAGGFVLYALT